MLPCDSCVLCVQWLSELLELRSASGQWELFCPPRGGWYRPWAMACHRKPVPNGPTWSPMVPNGPWQGCKTFQDLPRNHVCHKEINRPCQPCQKEKDKQDKSSQFFFRVLQLLQFPLRVAASFTCEGFGAYQKQPGDAVLGMLDKIVGIPMAASVCIFHTFHIICNICDAACGRNFFCAKLEMERCSYSQLHNFGWGCGHQ